MHYDEPVDGTEAPSQLPPRTAREMVGDTLVITFIRPEARNALDSAMIRELRQAIEDMRILRPAACVFIGTGKVFCAGGDLKERRAMSKAAVRQVRREIVDLFVALADSPTPLIAALNGSAYGGGFELALACDFVVAAEHIELALPEVSLGIIPAGGGTQNLVRLAGLSLARQVILLGRKLTAMDALGLGIVLSVHPEPEVLAAALELAGRLAARPRLAVLQARRAMRDAWGYDMEAALQHENDLYDPCIEDPERDQALERFAAHRSGPAESH
jgi:enoyl-CoA hydratase/carnithine racemase